MKNITLRALSFASFAILFAELASAQTGPFQYFPVTPCRSVDTRNPNGTNGGPALGPQTQKNVSIRGTCGVPSTARGVSLNLTITGATAPSFLAIWPSGQARPVVSTINFGPQDPALANGAIVGLSTLAQDLSIFNDSGQVHVIVDVTGYFQ